MPALLPGVRCYADASLTPDHALPPPRTAGLGVFLVNTQVQPVQTINIRAIMSGAHSVIMAEAAALVLAATVNDLLNFNSTTFLSDCKQLVHFLNATDQDHPPDWRMKSFTQLFTNCAARRQAKIYKINRNLNTTAMPWLDKPYLSQILLPHLLSLCALTVIIVIGALSWMH